MAKSLTLEDVKSYALQNSDAICVSDVYVRNSEKLKFLCHCGKEFNVAFNKFKAGQTRCKSCSTKIRGLKRAKTDSQFKAEALKIYGDEYVINETYAGALIPISVTHVTCDYSWKAIPTHFLGGRSCPECSKKRVIMSNRKTHKEFVKEVYGLVGDEYSVTGEYVNSLTKVKLKHNTCGFEWDSRPAHFTHNNRRCPQCSFSKGEELIADFLIEKNIKFKSQAKFDGCRSHINNAYLSFDFAVFENNGDDLRFLIEFDGRQHYEPVEFWGGEKRFSVQKEYDSIKNRFCLENEITLVRIPYWDQHRIGEILEMELIGGVEIA